MIERITIIGTGLIGASVGLALRDAGFLGEIAGWDHSSSSLDEAYRQGAITVRLSKDPDSQETKPEPGVIVLAGPVLSILDWMERLAPHCGSDTLITDVGSTKLAITHAATRLYNRPGRAGFLPGHPMAGKESGGAALAEAGLFGNAAWLFSPAESSGAAHPLEAEWRGWVGKFGARILDLPAARHDEICAWVSHLPQMLSTALAALLEDTFADDPDARDQIAAIGGRALRETTRLGSSPYSMWRDVALTNTDPIAETLHALEQRLAHLRENLRTPELREEFRLANLFRRGRP
jgi:prephenate dehydrogenase